MSELAKRSNENLLVDVKSIRRAEREHTADIVRHLAEIEARGIFRDAGYSSLFVYCREALGYSEGSAYRRVQAAKCLRSAPELYEKLKSGETNICVLAELARVMTAENSRAILSVTEGTSRREAEKVAAELGAVKRSRRERVQIRKVTSPVKLDGPLFTSPEAARVGDAASVSSEIRRLVSFEMTEEVWKLVEEARQIVGPVPVAKLFEQALRTFVKKHRPERLRQRDAEVTSPVKRAPVAKSPEGPIRRSRVISRPIKRAVVARDDGQCTFVAPDGRRCTERHCLQIDHIEPYALGGANTAENLRLLCPAHNRLFAERTFGKALARGRGRSSLQRD